MASRTERHGNKKATDDGLWNTAGLRADKLKPPTREGMDITEYLGRARFRSRPTFAALIRHPGGWRYLGRRGKERPT